MSEQKATFIERCLSGDAFLDDFDDAVEQWHASNASCSLAQFLGLKDEEYAIIVANPDALRAIVYARKFSVPLVETLEWHECPTMAARTKSAGERRRILHWLKKTKRIP